MDFDPYQSHWRENVPPMTLLDRAPNRNALRYDRSADVTAFQTTTRVP